MILLLTVHSHLEHPPTQTEMLEGEDVVGDEEEIKVKVEVEEEHLHKVVDFKHFIRKYRLKCQHPL